MSAQKVIALQGLPLQKNFGESVLSTLFIIAKVLCTKIIYFLIDQDENRLIILDKEINATISTHKGWFRYTYKVLHYQR